MRAEIDPARRVRVLGAVLLIGVFAAGAVFGAGLIAWRRPATEPPRHGPPHGPPPHHLARELGLDDAQLAELRRLEAENRAEIDAITRETMPRIQAVRDRIEEGLRPHLDAEQQARLDALRARRPPPGHEPPPFGPPPHHRPPPP